MPWQGQGAHDVRVKKRYGGNGDMKGGARNGQIQLYSKERVALAASIASELGISVS